MRQIGGKKEWLFVRKENQLKLNHCGKGGGPEFVAKKTPLEAADAEEMKGATLFFVVEGKKRNNGGGGRGGLWHLEGGGGVSG